MKKFSKLLNLNLLSLLAAIGMFFAATSAGHCWLWNWYQKECPAHLIKED